MPHRTKQLIKRALLIVDYRIRLLLGENFHKYPYIRFEDTLSVKQIEMYSLEIFRSNAYGKQGIALKLYILTKIILKKIISPLLWKK